MKTMEMGAPSYLHHKLVLESMERPRYVTWQTVGGDMTDDPIRLEPSRKSWRTEVDGQMTLGHTSNISQGNHRGNDH